MLEKRKKTSVWRLYQTNEKGFSYISMLISISILSITLPFFSYLLAISNQLTTNYSELYTQQFFQFLRDEVIASKKIDIDNNKITLIQGDSKVLIEQYDNQIRRQVNGTGHEILLQNIDKLTFQSISYGFEVNIKNSKGDSYGKTIIFYE